MRISFLMTVLIIIISDQIRNTVFPHEENWLNIWYPVTIFGWNQGGQKGITTIFLNGVVPFKYNTGNGVTMYIAEQLLTSPAAHYCYWGAVWKILMSGSQPRHIKSEPLGVGPGVSICSKLFPPPSPQVILMFSQGWEPREKAWPPEQGG